MGPGLLTLWALGCVAQWWVYSWAVTAQSIDWPDWAAALIGAAMSTALLARKCCDIWRSGR